MMVFEQVKLLYEEGLYSNVSSLSNLLISVSDHCPEFLSQPFKYQMLVYYGNSLYYTAEYKRAESIYKKALQLKKTLNKNKGKSPGLPNLELTSEVEIKFQMHLCYCQLKQYNTATAILESIPAKQRTSKVNMALAKLYHQTGFERSAITAFKEVLRECPLAIEAAQGLLALGVKGTEVASFMVNGLSGSNPYMEWISNWIKAHHCMANKEFSTAVIALKQLDSKVALRDNVDLLSKLGEAYYYYGDYGNALTVLQRAHLLDPLQLKGMDVLSVILTKEKKTKELESLAVQLMSVSEQAPEAWIAMAYFCFVTKKATRSVYFGQKAYFLDNRSIEALILKGTVFLEMKKYHEATLHFREAVRIAPHHYEAHKGLIDCYMAQYRNREAITLAANTCKQLGQTSRSLTLYASVLAKDPLSLEKAKTLLEKALKQDTSYLNAVYLLAEIYEQERNFVKGIELLKKHANLHSTCKLHQMLGDFLAWSNEHEKALDHYNIALNLDPSNSRALEGMQRTEQHTDALDSSYEVEVEDAAESDNEAEESGAEAGVWSDVEFA